MRGSGGDSAIHVAKRISKQRFGCDLDVSIHLKYGIMGDKERVNGIDEEGAHGHLSAAKMINKREYRWW